MGPREVKKLVSSRPATDGAGVKINRLTGFARDFLMDPFLMLDEIRSDTKDDFVAGFPPHPHRGFETVTYMREGGFSHEDSMANSGTITKGGAQWMTAGSGVIHSEMPTADADRIHGFQFWLNLPAREKMRSPEYRDIQMDEIPVLSHPDAEIRLIAGSVTIDGETLRGAVDGKATRPLIADVTISSGGTLSVAYPSSLATLFYVYEGVVSVAGTQVRAGKLAYLGEGDLVVLNAGEDSGLLLFGGQPINEPVAHYGPFVMTTQEEIEQAMQDYRDGTLVQA